MFKKTMKFDDLEGNEVSQTFYFNYNKKEIAELIEFGYISQFPSDTKRLPLEEQLKLLQTPVEESGLTQVENNQQAYAIFQDLILDAYGEKGSDNVTFVKNQRTRDYFKNHVAFVELIFEFLAKPAEAAQFIENCLPPKLVARAKEEMQAENDGKLSSSTISEMVEEAAERQKNPETRIEPGLKAAVEAGVAPPEVLESPFVKPEDLTEQDIMSMDEISFRKLDVNRLSKEQMQVAFRRKMQNG